MGKVIDISERLKQRAIRNFWREEWLRTKGKEPWPKKEETEVYFLPSFYQNPAKDEESSLYY